MTHLMTIVQCCTVEQQYFDKKYFACVLKIWKMVSKVFVSAHLKKGVQALSDSVMVLTPLSAFYLIIFCF